MTSKTSTYILVFLLSIFVVLLSVVMYFGIKNGNFKTEKSKLLLSETYAINDVENIDITSTSSDVKILKSEDDNIYVKIYSSKKDKVSSELDGSTLNIVSKSKSTFCFFCFTSNKRIEISIPEYYSGKINVDTKSGDTTAVSLEDASINISAKSGDVKLNTIKNVKIHLTSGDVEIKNSQNTNIKATSGDIELGSVTGKLTINVTSGDIEIDTFDIKADSSIKATSGDVSIDNVSNAYIETKVTSGDVKVNGSDRNALYELKIKVTSGDIEVN